MVQKMKSMQLSSTGDPMVPSNSPQPQRRPSRDEEMIRMRAYQRWEAAGRPEGDGVNFWLEAEREPD